MTALENGSGTPRFRKLLIPLVLGIAGTIATGLLVHAISPLASSAFQMRRGEIARESGRFMESLGYNLEGLQQDVWFAYGARAQMYLQKRLGMEEANRMVRSDSLPVDLWHVQWYNRGLSLSQNTERFVAELSPSGRIVSFDHVIQDTAIRPSLTAEEAKALAETALSRQYPDFASYHLRTSSDIKQLHRTDHHFEYAKSVNGFELILNARVQGNELGSVYWSCEFGGEFNSDITSIVTSATLSSTGSMALTFLLFLFVVTLFLRKYHEGEVGVRTGTMIFLAYIVLAFLVQVNQFSSAGSGTQIGDLNRFYVQLIVSGMQFFIFQVFLGVFVFAAWAVGESSSRTVWPEKMHSVDSGIFGKFFTRDVGMSLVNGYGWGLGLLGVFALVVWGLLDKGVTLFSMDRCGAIDTIVPGMHPVVYGIISAGFMEIVTRLFFLSFVAEKTRRTWLAIAVSVAAWVGIGLFMWSVPFGMPKVSVNLLVLLGFGIAFAFLFLKFDLLTAICAHSVVATVSGALPLLVSTGDAFAADRILLYVLLALPLVVAVIGLIRNQRFEFTLETMPRHIQRISERVRMAKELEIARNVQLSLLPKEQPQVKGYDIAGVCIPAEEVGGDYFDFVMLGGGKIGIALGDVSGKGVPAAIYMTLTKGILQSHAERSITPKAVLSKVNGLMYKTIERNSFVSMLYAILDSESRLLRFSRAGQCPVILTHDVGGTGAFLTPKGMALGLEHGKVFDAVLEEQELTLKQGETVVFYTDGFTEAMNYRAEEFGERRLVEAVHRYDGRPAKEIIDGVCGDIKRFTGSVPQHDDMTMVVVKVCGEG